MQGSAITTSAQKELYENKRWWLGLTQGEIFEKNVALYPDRECLVGGGARYTHVRLKEKVDRLAYELIQTYRLSPGDRVMLQLPNWPEFLIAHLAIQRAGLVMVLLTVNHSLAEIEHIAKLTEAKGWFLPSRYREKDLLPLLEKVRKTLTSLNCVVFFGETEVEGYDSYKKIDAKPVSRDEIDRFLGRIEIDPNSISMLLPSGGTTNLPKCAVRTHNDFLCNVEYKSRAWDMNITDTSLVATTVGHNLALLVSVSGALFHGAKIVMLESTRPEDMCRAIQDEKVTAISLVPTLASRLVNYEKLKEFDLSSLKKMYVGAANSPPELVKRVEKRMGCTYVNAFGMVEGPCSQTRLTDPLEIRASTIGRPVCPYDDFQTFNEKGGINPPGVEGELAVRGPGVFMGYYNNDQANKTAFYEKGYFHTGDLAVIDNDGLIRITGRIKDIIIRGGKNIAARDVEDAVSAHPYIEYVAAVGMPDKDLGEVVCVYVKTVAGKTISYEELIGFLKDRAISKHMLPARMELVSELCLTAAGKADKKVLKRDIENKVRAAGS
jgi:2,3-dihydroxybenzoate-AMP ligase/mycobactin salicyl-AMP ligase